MIKQAIPWPLKVAAKLLFGALGVNYRVLKRARLVEHGRMEDAAFSRKVFERHVIAPLRERSRSPGGALLELGPGDSIATGILGHAAGFSLVLLVDAGPFADLNPDALNRLNASLGGSLSRFDAGSGAVTSDAQLAAHGVRYLTAGVRSLRLLAGESVRHSFSNTVLQHIYRDEVSEIVDLLGALHASGTLSSHAINFTDHFSGGFINQRLPDWVMESGLIKRAHLYTNRLSPKTFCDLFESAGFSIRRVTIDLRNEAGSEERLVVESAEGFRAAVERRQVVRVNFLLEKK